MPQPSFQASKKNMIGISRHVIKLPQQEQQQKLSYQTNKLAQYIQLQLSDLQNTLHYIQKKHSINQIKQSISHSYNIFSQTQPIFRQLRINFIYDKIKKLVNCFSIIYLILMEHIQKPSRLSIDPDNMKNNDSQIIDGVVQQNQDLTISRKNTIINQRKKTNHFSQITQYGLNQNNCTQRPKPLGGIHLFNQQYNRHIESDLDRLKRKLKQQAKQIQDSSNPKVSQKQRLKQEIFKQINTDIYGSPSPDQLTLFFNLNSNRYGSQLQYITFQDELQQIAAFFKQSQDQALQFLNKSRDDFIYLNFNQGFKQMMVQYKVQKQQQVNGFVGKVKNLFEAIKIKTIQKQQVINSQLSQLKKLQQKITKPITYQIQTQTSYNIEQQILRLNKRIIQLQTNYNSLQDYHKNENQSQQKNITYLQHKIAFKDHQILLLKKQLQEKSHFIDFLNQKINNNTDPKLLRKISNIYKNHSKKNSYKLKNQLELLEKQGVIDINNLKNKNKQKYTDEDINRKNQKSKSQPIDDQQETIIKQRKPQKSMSTPFEDYQKPNKKKRKQGISFFASPDKRFTSYIQRKASFNMQNTKIQQANSQMEKATSEDIPLFQEQFQQNKQVENKLDSISGKDKQKKNLVKHDKRKSQDRNSLQVVQKSKSKAYQPKRSAFASGINNSKFLSSQQNNFNGKESSMGQNISEDSMQDLFEEQELMKQLNKMSNNDQSFMQQDQDNQNQSNLQQNQSNAGQYDEQNESNQEQFKQSFENDNTLDIKTKQEIANIKLKSKQIKEDQDKNNKIIEAQGKFKVQNKKQAGDKKLSSNQKSPVKNVQTGLKNLNSVKQNKNKLSVKKSLSNQYESNQNLNIEQRFQSFQQKQTNIVTIQQKNKQQNEIFKQLKNKKSRKNKKIKRENIKNQDQNDQNDQNDNFQSDEQVNANEDQSDDQNDENNEENTFLKTISGFTKNDGLNSGEKQSMISTYFTTLYKQQKSKQSNLHSRLIDISIKNQLPIQKDQKNQNKSKNQVLISVSNKQFRTQVNKLLSVNQRSANSKAEDVTSIRNRSKYSSISGNLSDMKKNRGKLSQLAVPDSLLKFRENKIVSENLIENLTTFKEIETTQQLKEQEDATQRQNKQNTQQEESKKAKLFQKKQSTITDYDKIYGISSASCNRNQREISELTINKLDDKQKMQDYLQKVAMKAAIKCKNIEEFKAKIKKMHLSKCGQSCKHLQRYLQNFNKYRSNNRQIMKIHIQNVNHTIPQQNELILKGNKQNGILLPSINILSSTGFSSKGFNSGQKGQINLIKK